MFHHCGADAMRISALSAGNVPTDLRRRPADAESRAAKRINYGGLFDCICKKNRAALSLVFHTDGRFGITVSRRCFNIRHRLKAWRRTGKNAASADCVAVAAAGTNVASADCVAVAAAGTNVASSGARKNKREAEERCD